jgi:hypothetical protein
VDQDPIDQVAGVGLRLLGPDHPTAATMRQRLRWYPDGLTTYAMSGRVVAYSLAYLLSPLGVEDIMNRSLTRASELTDQHFTTSEHAAGLYVSVLAGSPGYESLATRLAAAHVARTLGQARGVQYLFARGATSQGTRLLSRLGFSAVGWPSEIQVRQLPPSLASTDWPLATRRQVVELARRMRNSTGG